MTGPTLDLLLLLAGVGERLRPLTDVCPKPLLPLAGRCAADLALDALARLPLRRRYANVHHLPAMVEAWAARAGLDGLQHEPVLLDTGGAIGRAIRDGRIEAEHLVVHNGDVVHEIDLAAAWQAHLASGAGATLLVVSNPEVDTLLHRDGRFVGVLGHARSTPTPGALRGTYSGIGFYRTAILAGLRADAPWSAVDLWFDRLASHGDVHVLHLPDAVWTDCGRPRDLAKIAARRLRARGLDRWVDPAARVAADAVIGPGAIVEAGAEVGAGAVLEGTILLPGGRAAPGERLGRVIRNAGGEVPVEPA